MLQCFQDPVIVHRSGHMIRGLLHLVPRVPHGNTNAGMTKHLDIIPTVTESHGLLPRETIVIAELLDTNPFIHPPGYHVGTRGGPPHGGTGGQ